MEETREKLPLLGEHRSGRKANGRICLHLPRISRLLWCVSLILLLLLLIPPAEIFIPLVAHDRNALGVIRIFLRIYFS